METRLANINLIKKILIGLVFTFIFGIFTLNNPSSVQASALKNKSFTIYKLGPKTSVRLLAINDDNKNDKRYGSSWGFGGSISYKLYDTGDGYQKLCVTMTNVNVTDWTPYLEITTGGKTGYYPSGWSWGTMGGNGINGNHGTPVHNKSDEFTNGTCSFYIGYEYGYNDVSCKWSKNKYMLHISWNGATKTAEGRTDTSAREWGGWYEYDSYCKQLFGGAQPERTGYTFIGWYCGDNKLYDTNGYVVKNATVDGKTWSDKDGNYKWAGDTWLVPKWISNKKLTFTYDSNAISWVDGGGTYSYGATATSTAHLKTGYHFVKYHGTKYDGNGEQDWDANGSNFPSTTWSMYADRTINIVTAPNSHILDVNVNLEGTAYCGGVDDIRYDVYVNGQLSKQNVPDYYQYLNYGDNYKVVMYSSGKYNYSQATYEGTMGDSDTSVDIYASLKWFTMTSYHYKWNQHTNNWDYFTTTTESAKWGTTYTPPYRTPDGYYNHHRDWDGGWTVSGDGGFNVYYYPNTYYLDVNPIKNNIQDNCGFDDIRFNVYINGTLINSNVQDYCMPHLYGDTYKIEMIANSNYTYEKSVYEGTIYGTTYVEPRALSVPIIHRVTTVQDGNDNFYAYGYVTSDGPINRVEFPSWTEDQGQDDLLWPWERASAGNWTINGQTYNYRKLIKSSEHSPNGTDGHNWYNVHAYAFNDYGGAGFNSTTFQFRYNVSFNYNKPLNASSAMNGNSENIRTIIYKEKLGTNNGSSKIMPIPSMVGWTFNGWYTSATGGSRVDDNTIYTWKCPIILYAHWTANKYTVNFNYNKPSNSTSNIAGNSVTSKTVTYDSAYGELPNPTLRGWTFNGWFTSPTGGNQVTASTIYRIAGNSTLYAHWTANIYTVTFDYNKPSNATSTMTGNDVKTKNVTYDTKYGTLPNPGMRGWTFNGWFTAPTGGSQVTANTIYNIVASNQTLYAHWTANIYEIVLDSKLEGHTGDKGTTVIYEKFDTGFYLDKGCTNKITKVTPPKKIGNAFNGYKYGNDSIIDKNGNIVIKTNYFAENATITAKWSLNTYTIVFIGNRNSSGGTNVLNYTWNDNDNGKKPLTKNGYVRNGWKFVHWNTSYNDYADNSSAYQNNRKYNDEQIIGNQFFIDNLGTNVLLDGTSHTVQLYASWRDITTPKIKSIKIEQETLLSQVNKGAITLSTQKAYEGELYTNMTVKVNENNTNNDASGIKNVSVYVYDKDNTSVNKTYDITNNKSNVVNTKYDFAYDNKYNPYSGTYTFKQNLYKEFPNAAKLGIYVYVTDYQGNTTKTTARWEKVTKNTAPNEDVPQDKPKTITDENKIPEDIVFSEINACIYSQYVTSEGSKDFGVGETGITTTWTYGYVESYSLDYLNINAEMEKEIAENQLSEDNRMNRSKVIGRDINGKVPLASIDTQAVRVPPYVLNNLSTASGTTHEDGTVRYKDLLNNKYTATGYKGTAQTGIYNTYNIMDTEYQSVHYRSGI